MEPFKISVSEWNSISFTERLEWLDTSTEEFFSFTTEHSPQYHRLREIQYYIFMCDHYGNNIEVPFHIRLKYGNNN